MTVCKYFMQGHCRHGDSCWYEHPSGGNKGFSLTAQRQLFGGGNKSGVSFGNPNPYKWTAQGAQQQQQQQQQQNKVSQVSAEDIVKSLANEIVMNWENGKMWPFSCFGYEKDSPGLPGFSDVSPEELRLEAYEALKQGNIQPYAQKVESLYNGIKSQWQEMKNPSLTLRQKLVSLIEDNRRKASGSGGQVSLFSESGPFGSSSSSTGLFGQGNQPSTNAFGQAGSQSSFRQTASQSTFGQTGTQSLFGQSTTNQPTFGMAQSGTGQGQNPSGPPSGFFSQSSSQQTSTSSSFGSTGGSTVGTGLFGAQSSSGTTGKNLFGAQGSQSSAPGTNLFGAQGSQSSAPGTNLFGAQASQSGAPGTNLFGKPVLNAPVVPSGSSFSAGGATSVTPLPGSTGSESSSVYTPMEKLTAEELAQFQAQTFCLGKIPTKPPPRELC